MMNTKQNIERKVLVPVNNHPGDNDIIISPVKKDLTSKSKSIILEEVIDNEPKIDGSTETEELRIRKPKITDDARKRKNESSDGHVSTTVKPRRTKRSRSKDTS